MKTALKTPHYFKGDRVRVTETEWYRQSWDKSDGDPDHIVIRQRVNRWNSSGDPLYRIEGSPDTYSQEWFEKGVS